MTVDKGGLRYPIEVVDLFTGPLREFRTELERSMSAFKAFKAQAQGGLPRDVEGTRSVLRDTKRQVDSQKKLNRSRKDGIAELEREFEAVKNNQKALTDYDRAKRKNARQFQNERVDKIANQLQDEKSVYTQKRLNQLARERNTLLAKQKSDEKILRRVRAANERLAAVGADPTGFDLSNQEAVQRRIRLTKQRLQEIEEIEKRFGAADRGAAKYLQQDLGLDERLKQVDAALKKEDALLKRHQKTYDRLSEKRLRDGRLNYKDALDRDLARAELARAKQRANLAKQLQQTTDPDRQAALASDLRAIKQRSAAEVAAHNDRVRRIGQEVKAADKSRRKRTAGEKQQQNAMAKTESRANRIAFTFKRLFGIYASFTAIRLGVQGFNTLVGDAIRYNAQIEQSRLGIASLITAVAEVADFTGNSADSATQLKLAQKEAYRQTELLRKSAIETAATFDQLVQTYQIGLAPGLKAGLDLDQVREFTVRIAQAAASIGLPQNQLAEEIRSILSGTIQARTTRIAVALGITNEDIRRAKELGILYEFLEQRFKAFEIAGAEAAQTLTALAVNTRALFQQAVDEGSKDFFKGLKDLLRDIQAVFKVRGEDDMIKINPKVVAAVEAVASGLTRATQQARLLVKNLSGGDVTNFGSIIGAGIGTGAEVLRLVIEGVVAAFSDLKKIFSSIYPVIQSIVSTVASVFGADVDTSNWKEVLKYIVRFAAVSLALSLTWVAIKGTFGTLLKPVTSFVRMANTARKWGVVQKMVSGIGPAFKSALTFAGPLLLKGAAFAATIIAIVAGLKEVTSAIVGVDLNFETFYTLVGNMLRFVGTAIGLMKERIELFAKELPYAVTRAIVYSLTIGIRTLVQVLDKALDSVGLDIFDGEKFEKNVQEGLLSAYRNLFGAETVDNYTKASEDLNKRMRQAWESTKAVNQTIIEANENYRTFGQVARDVVQSVTGYANTVTESILAVGTNSPDKEIKYLSQAFLELAGVVSTANTSLDETKKRIDSLKEATERDRLQLDISNATANLSQQQSEEVAIRKKTAFELAKFTENLANKEVLARKRGFKLQADLDQELLRQKGAFNEDERANLDSLIDGYKNLVALQNRRSEIAQEVAEAQRAYLSEEKYGDPEKAAELKINYKKLRDDFYQAFNDIALEMGKIETEVELLPEDKRQAFLEAALRVAKLRQLMASSQNDVVKLQKQQSDAATAYANKIQPKLIDLARDETAELFRQYAIRVATIKANEAILKAGSLPARQGQQELQDSNLQVAKAEEDLLVFRLAAEDRLAAARKAVRDAETFELKVAAQARLMALEDEISQNGQILQQNLDLLSIDQQRLALRERRRQDGVAGGLAEGANLFMEDFQSTFQAGINIATDALNSFADTLGGTLIDALDPSASSAEIEERWRNFLRGLFNIITSEMIKLGIAKLLVQIGAGGAAGGATGGDFFNTGAFGYHSGGKIGSRSRRPSRRHSTAPGFAFGGRPLGLHPRDTVPIWADPREWVIRASSVSKYGDQVMRALNEGRIDPGALSALAGSMGTSRVRPATPKTGFASGGTVSEGQRMTAPGMGRSVVVSSEDQMDRLISGGEQSLVRFMRRKRRDIGMQEVR